MTRLRNTLREGRDLRVPLCCRLRYTLDEYESYVPRIWKLLVVEASVEDIAAALRRIEQDQMDSAGNGTQPVAERLKDWWYWRFKYPDELRR